MRVLALLVAMSAAVSASVPMPPMACQQPEPRIVTVIEDAPAIYANPFNNEDQSGRVISDGKALYAFVDFGEIPWECEMQSFEPIIEDPDDFAPIPPIEPGYDEHDPIGPIDDGAPGAPTVDKP